MTTEEREREIERIDHLIPQQPTNRAGVIRILEERALLVGNRIVYKVDSCWDPLEERNKQMIRCCCSACGETWYSERVEAVPGCHQGNYHIGYWSEYLGESVFDGSQTICPQCGADEEMEALHVSSFGNAKKHIIDHTHLITVENAGGHLAVMDWYARRMVDKDGIISTEIYPFEACVVIGGQCVRYNGYTYVYPCGDSFHPWRRRMKYRDETYVTNIRALIPFSDELVAQTDAEKSGFEDYCRSIRESDSFFPASYLQLWCKYPNAENLARAGYGRWLTGMIHASRIVKTRWSTELQYFSPIKTRAACDWKKAKPNEIIGMEKSDFQQLAGSHYNDIELWRKVKAVHGLRMDHRLLSMAAACGSSLMEELLEKKERFGRRIPAEKTIRYCYREKSNNESFRPGDLLDHWRIVAAYYGGLPESVMYPKNFAEAHRKFGDLLASSGKNRWDADVAAQAKVMMKYAWGDPETGLRIFPAKSETELKNEGKALDHCVGSYAESMAKGETTIFFIRRIKRPNAPYFTLEWKNGAVAQNRGKKNCKRTPDVEAFEKKWIAHVKEVDAALKKMKKEKKQNGKSDADGKRGHAAA